MTRFLRLFAQTQLMPVLESGEETTLVGGQAVLEGVMMRAPHSYCVAVRKPDGELITEEQAIPRMSEKYPIFKYPILRGLGTLGQAMTLGFRALKFSMNAALNDGEQKEEVSSWMMTANIVFSLGFFIVMYKFVPLFLASRIASSRLGINVWDGVIRIGIFLAFLFLLSRMKDIRRVFEYHGAEHKVVFNFESGKPVTVENAQQFTTFHPRCGTSFLFVVFLLAIPIYTLIPFDDFATKLIFRVALMPVIAGVSYELIRFAAKRRGSFLATLAAPGLWMQRITTKPPSDDQAAVAIQALEGAMKLEKSQGGQLVIA